MTLEQKIRNSGETGVIGVEYKHEEETIKVLDDYEGVLKCFIQFDDGNIITRYLNSDTFYQTHQEAFMAEL